MTDEIRAACADAVHVYTADGRWLRAGQAALHILEGLGYRRFAGLFGSRALIGLTEWGYGVVAHNRLFFSRFLFTRE